MHVYVYASYHLISIHAPREGCDRDAKTPEALRDISIHAPREGCDALHELEKGREPISIHAPREGCDGSI